MSEHHARTTLWTCSTPRCRQVQCIPILLETDQISRTELAWRYSIPSDVFTHCADVEVHVDQQTMNMKVSPSGYR